MLLAKATTILLNRLAERLRLYKAISVGGVHDVFDDVAIILTDLIFAFFGP